MKRIKELLAKPELTLQEKEDLEQVRVAFSSCLNLNKAFFELNSLYDLKVEAEAIITMYDILSKIEDKLELVFRETKKHEEA